MSDGRFRFDNFVVGAANRLATSAARAVAESPGVVYNPLFIHGASGLGKSHLLGALGHRLRALYPGLTVAHLTLETFAEELQLAVSSGRTEEFRRRYEASDVLLLDDMQFVAGRAETATELLRIVNALQESGRQIVMTCDSPPSGIAEADARLLTRLSGGLVVDVGLPDFGTRVAILRRTCEARSLGFGEGVLEALARAPSANVRELQGALNKLVVHQSIEDGHLAVSDVERITGTGETTAAPDEFESFVSALVETVALSVDGWRMRLAESIARWSGEGFHTASLERFLDDEEPPDLDAMERDFALAADRLRDIEAEVIRLDPTLTGAASFRDPERVREAEQVLARTVARLGRQKPFSLHDEATGPELARPELGGPELAGPEPAALAAAVDRFRQDDVTDFGLSAQSVRELDSFFLDAEKVVAEWPHLEGRVIEELR